MPYIILNGGVESYGISAKGMMFINEHKSILGGLPVVKQVYEIERFDNELVKMIQLHENNDLNFNPNIQGSKLYSQFVSQEILDAGSYSIFKENGKEILKINRFELIEFRCLQIESNKVLTETEKLDALQFVLFNEIIKDDDNIDELDENELTARTLSLIKYMPD